MHRSQNTAWIGGTLLALLAFCFAAEAQNQQANDPVDPETTTRLTLGGASGTPGSGVVVPVYFTPAQGVAVARLRIEVTYVSVSLRYADLDRGIAAELGSVDVAIDVEEGRNEQDLDTQTLTITASFGNADPPATGIPSGLLAYITMDITDDGRPASVSLRPTVEATLVGSGDPVPNLRAFETQVDVLAPGTEPLISCFFFTH